MGISALPLESGDRDLIWDRSGTRISILDPALGRSAEITLVEVFCENIATGC